MSTIVTKIVKDIDRHNNYDRSGRNRSMLLFESDDENSIGEILYYGEYYSVGWDIPTVFAITNSGSGSIKTWINDAHGDPLHEVTLDTFFLYLPDLKRSKEVCEMLGIKLERHSDSILKDIVMHIKSNYTTTIKSDRYLLDLISESGF